jgi:hypothetical protein
MRKPRGHLNDCQHVVRYSPTFSYLRTAIISFRETKCTAFYLIAQGISAALWNLCEHSLIYATSSGRGTSRELQQSVSPEEVMLLTAMGGNQSNVILKLDTTDVDDDVNSVPSETLNTMCVIVVTYIKDLFNNAFSQESCDTFHDALWNE